ncbi:hypothetical protein [Streptomyces mexicanus]|uniref:hypothetical protein n=1 Tax=Streptomyces mexicanus TaxID=178566 RepID=UPI0036589534
MRPIDPATVDRLADLYRAGTTDAEAARIVGISKTTAGAWRRRLDIGPAPKQPSPLRSPLTLTEKWHTLARTVEGGHAEWTGRHRADTGTRVLTHHGREHTARSVAFRIANGRDPIGYVRAECDAPEWCVAPDHMADEPARTTIRAQLAAVHGRAQPRPYCDRGHAAAEHVRYDREGRAYCATCHAERTTARKANAA